MIAQFSGLKQTFHVPINLGCLVHAVFVLLSAFDYFKIKEKRERLRERKGSVGEGERGKGEKERERGPRRRRTAGPSS